MDRTRLLLSVLLAGLLAACSGGGPATTTTSDPTDAPMSERPAATPVITTATIGKSFWFAGFKVTLGDATAELTDGARGNVTIEARFENVGEGSATFDGTLALDSAGTTYEQDDFTTDLPSVPAGGSGKGTLGFRVEDDFTFDDAVLTVGLPANNQAVVPFGSAGTFVSLEPKAISASGTGKADTLQIDLRSAELRADLPQQHSQTKKGHLALTFTYDATFNSSFAGGFAFTGENVALRLPDGTTVGPIQDGRSQSIELLSPNATTKDLFSRFEIDDPAAGTYTFLVRNGQAEGEIEVTIP